MKKLPSPDEIVARTPLSEAGQARVRRDRAEVREILSGKDPRLLAVVGPCSAWPSGAVLEYAARLAALQRDVRDALKLVLRIRVQAPRTARGWTGPLDQPDPFAPPDAGAGRFHCRALMVTAVEMGLALADEALFTNNARGFAELLAWIAIGARSSEDQEHRLWASAVDAPVGMENPTSGCIGAGVDGVLAAQSPHVAVFEGCQVQTTGNPFAHLVLRGGVDGPNHHLHDLALARRLLRERAILNPAVLIDASHDNCRIDGHGDPEAQEDVVREVLGHLHGRPELRALVRGFLLDSFVLAGNQSLERCTAEKIERGGLSITGPCLSWERTEALLLDLADEVRALGLAPRLRLSG
jgi:3-deoxy-7-phosphoheptulonate synthase